MNFYVGQRVRIINAPCAPWALGREATIISRLDKDGDHELSVDGMGPGWYALPSSLEPLIPPDMESLEETLRLWLPEDQEQTA